MKTLPEPRNPVIIVAGIRLSGGILVVTSESSVCVGADAEAEAETEENFRSRLELTTGG